MLSAFSQSLRNVLQSKNVIKNGLTNFGRSSVCVCPLIKKGHQVILCGVTKSFCTFSLDRLSSWNQDLVKQIGTVAVPLCRTNVASEVVRSVRFSQRRNVSHWEMAAEKAKLRFLKNREKQAQLGRGPQQSSVVSLQIIGNGSDDCPPSLLVITDTSRYYNLFLFFLGGGGGRGLSYAPFRKGNLSGVKNEFYDIANLQKFS